MQRINRACMVCRGKITCALDAEKNMMCIDDVHWMQRINMMCIVCREKYDVHWMQRKNTMCIRCRGKI
jgi:hypothetical protein